MKNIIRNALVGIVFCISFPVNGQDTLRLSLKNVVDLAINQSSSIKYQQNRYENSYWRYKNFKAQFRPQLILNGDLPNYNQKTKGVQQEDGNIKYVYTTTLEADARLSLNQIVPQTGTRIYASSSLERFQNIDSEFIEFNGAPYLVGFSQPIFAYNRYKWQRKTEPMRYTEAQRSYIEEIEDISKDATWYFFKYLTAQTNFKLSDSNLNNSEDNLKIAEKKIKLGMISENDYSRIRLSVLTAKKSLTQASMDLKNADFNLKKYIGLDQNIPTQLEIPLYMVLYNIDPAKALSEALENRKESIQYERQVIEAKQLLTKAKRNNGLAATLSGSYGTSNNANDIFGVYEDPLPRKQVRLSLAIPILDWGKSASSVKLAESQNDLTLFNVERQREDFNRNIIVQVEKFGLLKNQLEIAEEADKVAGNGYLIALKKFQSGEISITDLNISLSEREKAKRDYIKSLETYWVSYYHIRELTLYDFELDQKISYENPLLAELLK